MAWECGIEGCNEVFADAESAVLHQSTEHERRECKVCGAIVPDGYLAIRHAFSEHSRAEYVRAYGANAEDVREREELLDEIETEADIKAIASELKR
ncbi:DUF7565 family protein [Natronobacterium gregoryi]|uniref:C2H2-type domain-containing protein n=2 Tax=Natronobacterium gregoryi TaxID=44930 RepID=L0AJL1_NATGS|nr:hypothetical protein [Natronobacterium gregoryi]AFZ73235.1 hypothetical protein Natgr_2052 [Natronobacterium gregoryi SP2]ELY71307.1 hypothetical protein C490_05232 [Natronobacterium gregoryi SP2]PLK21643.1 hypothetical protein CYV19_03535 [Natronobacterium gregoryi SP2]SFI57792.1 hypothetical protein SAMN05443661_10229 [Natronobacterium gregoryi]